MSNESQVTTLDDAPNIAVSKPAKAAKGVTALVTEGDDEKFFIVTVHPTGDEIGMDAVDIGLNGYLTRLPRGVPCRVSASVLDVLTNAVVTTYKVVGDTVIERNTPRFPFSAIAA